MIKQWVATICAVSLLVGGPVWAKTDPALEQVKSELLKHKHSTKKRLLWVSGHARKNLINLATNRRETNTVRVRAIQALAGFQDKGTFRVLRELIFNPIEPRPVRAAAMEVLGEFHNTQVVGILKQFVLSDNPDFRLNAARGLERQGSEEACGILLQALSREQDLTIKEGLDRLFNMCKAHQRGEK